MSVQTGRDAIAMPPPSSRRIDRARVNISRLRNDPNPVWMRELKQAARLTRTPVILAVITGVIALLMCSVGGVASVATEPAKVGTALYHVFFSLAFAVVTWVAPAVAASTIASERSGRTWEALLLTGLSPATVARGKFLAALTYISLYIVMLVPVGSLPFLFGGVTATDVIAAFALLFLLGVLSVAFGLSISSQFASSAVAIVVTLLVAVPTSLLAYLAGGVGLSFAAHELWPQVSAGPPVWLPMAYSRADFGVEYLTFLVAAPLVCVAIPGWFLYEITLANMAGVSDDRSTRLRRWFAVSTPLLALSTLPPLAFDVGREWRTLVIGVTLMALFAVFSAFVFAGEPLGPSRRVRVHWERRGAGRVERFLGPGVMRAATLGSVLTLGAMALQGGAALLAIALRGGAADDATRVVAFTGYAMAFTLFVFGFAAWMRARSQSGGVPRVLLIGALFLAAAGPFLAMAIAGILSDGGDIALLIASPSPIYPFVLLDTIAGGDPETRQLALMAGAVAAAGWGFLGAGLLTGAATRTRRVVREHAASIAKVETMLAAEEAAADAPAAAPAEASSHE
ncbi:MAG: ABC transporter permease [Polyangiaceae bacterium]|nr:ABC transporter permease [Polyangiaceae bacterium]